MENKDKTIIYIRKPVGEPVRAGVWYECIREEIVREEPQPAEGEQQ